MNKSRVVQAESYGVSNSSFDSARGRGADDDHPLAARVDRDARSDVLSCSFKATRPNG
jgi:hypothetical protein